MALLDDILKKVRQGVQNVGNFVSRDIQRAPAVQAINQIRQAPQVQQIQNKVMNTRFIPGQVNTLDQVFRNVRQDPAKYLLSSSLAQGRLGTGNRRVDELLAKPAGQATNSLINMSSLGFVNLPGKKAETLPERIGQGVGTVAGFINPVGLAPKALGPIGLLGEKTVGRIAPKALSRSPKLVQSIAKAVGSEAAQSGAYVGAKKLTGQDADFQSDILAGLGLRGGFGLAAKGLKGYSPNAFDVHPDDLAVMDDFIKRVRGGGAKSALGKSGKDAQRLAEHYIGDKARNLSNEKLASVFEAVIKQNEGVPTRFPALGIAGKKNVAGGGDVKYLYRGSSEGGFRGIRQTGLLPEKAPNKKYIYFTKDELEADSYAMRKGGSRFGNRVMRVKATSDIELDPRIPAKTDYRTTKAISPENIEIRVGKDKWVPIQDFVDENANIMPINRVANAGLGDIGFEKLGVDSKKAIGYKHYNFNGNGIDAAVKEGPNHITVIGMYADKPGQGAGTAFVNSLKEYADKTGKKVIIAKDVSGSDFYKKFPYLRQATSADLKGVPREKLGTSNFVYDPHVAEQPQGLGDIAQEARRYKSVDEFEKSLNAMKSGTVTGIGQLPIGKINKTQIKALIERGLPHTDTKLKVSDFKPGRKVTQPVEVFLKGNTYVVENGNHRLAQALANGDTHIPVVFKRGEGKAYSKPISEIWEQSQVVQPSSMGTKGDIKVQKGMDSYVVEQPQGLGDIAPSKFPNKSTYLQHIAETVGKGKNDNEVYALLKQGEQQWKAVHGNNWGKDIIEDINVKDITLAERPLAVKPKPGRKITEPIEIYMLNGKPHLVDGRHRLDQAIANGETKIRARISGSSQDNLVGIGVGLKGGMKPQEISANPSVLKSAILGTEPTTGNLGIGRKGSLAEEAGFHNPNIQRNAGNVKGYVAEQPIPDIPQPKRIDEILSSRKDKGSLPLQSSKKLPTESQQIPRPESGVPTTSSSGGNGSSGRSIAQVPNSENPYFNTNKLNVKPEAKQQVNQVIQEVKPAIEKVVGKKLSNKEVINTANNSAKILRKVVDREQTEDFAARLLRTRQKLAAAADSGTVDREYIDNLMAVKSHATDIARKLQSFSIGADPKTVTSKDAILDAVLKVEKDSDKVIKAAEGVDFNDLNQSTDFYRKFIQPTWQEKMDLIRYNSMLSSPNTHIVNTASNLINSSVVAPIEKTLTGTLDFLGSQITGKKQTQFAGEGAAYAKGYWSSVNKAAHTFAESMRGKTVTGNLDVRQIPLSTSKRVARLNLPTRLLEGMDQFFTTLTKSGEEAALNLRKSKGVNVGQIETQALDNAKYRLFRSELHREGQGTVLNSIDDFTGLVQKARGSANPITSLIAKFTLPFVQTPMNIVKQGVEYSPVGFSTMIGAKNKTEQLSKAILGSSAAAGTAMLVASGRSTWSEPTDETKRQAFRSAGMQPYSLKIGNKWISYAKLPPALGFPIAFVSALNDAKEKRTIDDNELDIILNATAKFGNFFADQSYVKNIGDLVAAAKGSPENMTRFISNYPQQLVPYRALMGWMARLIDPYQRKVDKDSGFLEKQVQQLFTQIPGLSMSVPVRLDKAGEPIPNQNKEINSLTPFRVTTERPEQKELYDLLQQKSVNTKNLNILKKKIERGEDVTLPQAGAEGLKPTGQSEADKLRAKMQEDAMKEQVKMSGKSQKLPNGDIVYKDGDSVKTLKLSVDEKKGEGIEAFDVKNKKNEVARQVWGSNLSKEDKDYAFKKLGVDKEDVRYDYIASSKFDTKERANYIASKDLDQDTLYERLLTGRVESISGKMFVTNGVLDELADQGLISKADAKALKKVKLDKKGQPLAGSGGSGKGKGGTGKKQRKALANYFKDRSTSLSKLFASNIKNDRPSNASNLEKILKQRSPQNRGLKSIESILAQSEALTKKKRGGKTIQAVLGG